MQSSLTMNFFLQLQNHEHSKQLQIPNKTVQEDTENSNSSLASEGCANRRKYKQHMERST